MITIITICKNTVTGLKKTMDSVFAQESGDFEYVVVDGGSTDGSTELLSDYAGKCNRKNAFSYVSGKDSGIYDAMNKGVKLAKGEYVLFLNAGDCLYDTAAIAKFENAITGQDADAYYGDTLMHYPEGYGIYCESAAIKLNPTMPFIHQSVIVKRSLLLEHPFDLSYKVCADLEFFHWMRRKNCRFIHCNFIVSCYDARKGLSEDYPLMIALENDRIFGRDKNPHYWRRKLYSSVRITSIEIIKRLMPRNLLNRIHHRKRSSYIKWL